MVCLAEEQLFLITFRSAQQALRAEDLFGNRGLRFLTVPTPRELTAGCGLAIRLPWEDRLAALRALKDARIDIHGTYLMRIMAGGRSLEEMPGEGLEGGQP